MLANEEVYAENTYLSVAIDLGEDIASLLGGIGGTHIEGELSSFYVSSQNTEKTINLADPAIEIPPTAIPDNGLVEIRIPYDVGIDAGPYIAGEEEELSFHLGDLSTTFLLPTGLGNVTLGAECVLFDDDTTITSISIETLLDRINKAENEGQVRAVFNHGEIDLDLSGFNSLTGEEQADVIAAIISERPAQGYGSMSTVQQVIDETIELLSQIDEGPFVPSGTWIHGEGAPSNEIGEVGNYYLDKTTFNVYEKIEDGWVYACNMKAPEKDSSDPGKEAKSDNGVSAGTLTDSSSNGAKGASGETLPKTGTNYLTMIASGIALLMMGLLLQRRRLTN